MFFSFCRGVIIRELYYIKNGKKREFDLTVPRLIAKEKKKPVCLVWLRMAWSVLTTGCTFQEYYNLNFANRTLKNQKTFITTGSNLQAYQQLNDKAYYHLYLNKDEFNRTYADFIGREWVELTAQNREQVVDFFQRHSSLMVKPKNGDSGKGIFVIPNSDQMTAEEVLQCIESNSGCIAEELLHNHPKLNELNETSLNTMRIITVRSGEKMEILFAGIRFGAKGSQVDNISMGGYIAPIDLTSGEICGHSHTKKTVTNQAGESADHIGFRMPLWDELYEFMYRLTAVVPQMRYMAWDIAITPKGFAAIEGNHSSGNTVIQAHLGVDEQGLRVKLNKWTA